MKPGKLILTLGCIFFLYQPSQSQIFKKLKNKVVNAVEEAVVQKSAEKAAEESENALDKLFNMDFKKENDTISNDTNGSLNPNISVATGDSGSGGENNSNIPGSPGYPDNGDANFKPDLSNMPVSYGFEWIYAMNVEYRSISEPSGDIDMTFYFKDDANYYGFKPKLGPTQDMFMISDKSLGQTLIFLDKDDQKFVSSTLNSPPSENKEIENSTITKLDKKNVLGYECQGFKMEDDKYDMIFYVTFETSVGFSDLYGDNKYFPKNFDQAWNPEGDKEGVIMEMTMKEKSNGKTMKMTCTKFEEHPFTFDTTGYSTQFNGGN